jgi:AhpD family alkylhydroperoxidase
MNKKRISIKDIEPEAYKAMYALEAYSKKSTLDPKLKELIKMRASQINGCAYCVDMHTEDALKIGESERRIFALAVWHESQLFTEEERALLQLTEEVTKISDKGVTDETYERAIEFFGPELTAQIIMMIVAINGWNRIAVSTKQIYKP